MEPKVWYFVRDLDAARRFYCEQLGFEETAVDFTERWSHIQHGAMLVGLAEGEPRVDGAGAPSSRTCSAAWPRPGGR
jgi:catechol 2,3-dioxygenase-like lactoylglutathione lyase family enzyme